MKSRAVLRQILGRAAPGWDGALAEMLLLDRQSRWFSAFAVLLFLLAAAARGALAWRLRRRCDLAAHLVKPASAE